MTIRVLLRLEFHVIHSPKIPNFHEENEEDNSQFDETSLHND